MGYGLLAMGYGLWAMGYGLWAMGYGLWAMCYVLWAMAMCWTMGLFSGFLLPFTPLRMSPEVIRGKKYGAGVDIWSLGITLLELAHGEPPLNNLEPMVVRIASLSTATAFATYFCYLPFSAAAA